MSHDWERLPDRTTEDGQLLKTEVAEIDGETWFHGTIPSQKTAVSLYRFDPRRLLRWWSSR